MFKIDRENPWPPGTDLTTVRATLRGLERDMRRVPEFEAIAIALGETLRVLDKTEARSPKRLSDRVLTASRFMPEPRDP